MSDFTRHQDIMRQLADPACTRCNGTGNWRFEGTWIDCVCIRRNRASSTHREAQSDHPASP